MKLYKYIFTKLMGWKIDGDFKEKEIKKVVMIVVPHTSWHDFYVAIFTRKTLGVMVNFVGKKELFIWPFGYYFRWMGGAALDRTSGQNKVEAIADIFKTKEEFRLAMAPEGTRKKVKDWKTGYYYIAHLAKVPIMPVSFNYKTKTVTIGDPFYTTGDIKSDSDFLKGFYKGVEGKVVEYS
ncbi:MAG: 1-acyl-sn-glycerol-3-phosphate acyltransferase [Flavobacteriaceae bacterium]|nr:1-acyl-sn-glycerol-3-phosphate acyltransferase [Flavobacteriaceae bacterium]